jgi:hypothetical protein
MAREKAVTMKANMEALKTWRANLDKAAKDAKKKALKAARK